MSVPMKASGVEWLGEVPETWDTAPLKSFLQLRRDIVGRDSANTRLLSLTLQGVIERDLENPTGKMPASFDGYQRISAGEMVFCLFDMDETPRTVGVAPQDGMLTGAYTVFRPQSELWARYLYYFFLHVDEYKRLKPFYKGLRKTIRSGPFLSIQVPRPKESDAKAIVAHLDRATTRIDALVAKKTRFIELLHEEIVSLATSCQVAEGTRWIRLRHVSDMQSRPVDMEIGGSFTRLGLYNRGRGIFEKDAADTEDMGDSKFHWIEDGDLILSGQFAWEGAVAMAREKHSGCVVSHRYPIVRGRPSEAISEYLYAYFLTMHGDMVLNDCSRGSAGRNRPLNMGLLMNWKIPIPPMDIQKRIAKLLQKKEKAEALQKRSVSLLREHRTALITAAVTGKIDLRPTA